MGRRNHLTGRAVACLLFGLAALPSRAADECLDQSDAEGKPIRAFTVKSRWNSLSDVQIPVATGSPYTADAASKAINAVRQRLAREDRAETQTRGYVGVRYVEACPLKTEDGGINLVINATEVRLPLADPLSGVLPKARSRLPSSLNGSPPALKLLNPEIGLTQDSAMGVAQTLRLETDLLSASSMLHGKPHERPSWTLPVAVAGQRGFDTNTYEGFASIAVGHDAPVRVLQRFEVNADFQASRLPQGGATLFQNTGHAGSTFRLKPRGGPIHQLTLLPAFRFANSRRVSDFGATRDEEKAFQLVGIADAGTPFGPIRWATLIDTAAPRDRDSYRRVSTRLGWNGQIPISAQHTNQTIGVEVIAGAGRLWGQAPQYARYFAGNSGVNFLMEAADSRRLEGALTMPSLRSFGQSQAQTGFGGATSFWNVNLNIAIPIPRASFPLIPRDEIDTGVPLNVMVYNNGTRTSRSFLQSYYENVEGKTPEEAERLTNADVRIIEPALRFITRRANLYSVKPLLLYDAAHLAPGGNLPGRTLQAVGGGLQVTVVVARFEAGYLWTLNRRPGDSTGNFVLRLTFENLF